MELFLKPLRHKSVNNKLEKKYWRTIMKKLIAVLMVAVASMSALVGCGSSNNTDSSTGQSAGSTQEVSKGSLQDMLNAMLESGAVPMAMEIDETLAQEAYNIDLNVVEEYALAETGRSPGIGLIVMVKAKDGQVEAAKANMEALLQTKIGNAFYPDEVEAAEAGEIIVDGNYVALFILHDEVKADTIAMFNE